MFVIFDLQRRFRAECVGMFVVYPPILLVFNLNCLLGISIITKAIDGCRHVIYHSIQMVPQ